jgi:hypothetical protein
MGVETRRRKGCARIFMFDRGDQLYSRAANRLMRVTNGFDPKSGRVFIGFISSTAVLAGTT